MATPGTNLAGPSGALDTSLPTIYSEFMLLRDETGVCRDCATKYTLQPHTGTAKNIINYGRVVAYNVADGADINQNQTLSDTLSAYTPTEVAVQVLLPGSTMRRIADPDLEGRVAKMLNNAYNLKEDADGLAQFSSFTATAIGGASTVCSPGHVAAGGGQLRVGITPAAPEPVDSTPIFITHPWTAVPLAGRTIPYTNPAALTTPYGVVGSSNVAAHLGVEPGVGFTSGELQQALLSKGIGGLGMLAGVDVRQDANLIPDATTDDATGAFLVREGFIYVSELEPRLDPDTSDKSLRGAVEMNLWGSYTWGVYRAGNYGVGATFDAAKPTS